MPTAVVYEAIRFEVIQDSKYVGRILMVHGHQGTFESDIISGLARLFIRFIYRPLQRLTGIGRTTPAKDFCLREKHDREMYKWATQQNHLLLITGHTHRPVWTSRTHLQKLEAELKQLKTLPDTADKEERIEEITKQIKIRKEEYRPCDENKMDEENDNPLPVYFNTGCCRYEDGDITGIEIEDGNMRLIKWAKDSDDKKLLEKRELINIFKEIKDKKK